MSLVFLSHSSHDRSAAEEFASWLRGEGHESIFLDFHPDVGIPAGRNWEKELYHQLRISRAVIPLLSSHFNASRWCFAEIALARSLGKSILPVRISQCAIDPLLRDLQVVDYVSNQADAFAQLTKGLKLAEVEAQSVFQWDHRRCPYPGLLSYQEEDAAVYFGRERDLGRFLDAINQVRRYEGSGLILVLGASGSGKSSLLRAGVLPRLRRDPAQWLIVDPFRPGEDPFRELATVLSLTSRRADSLQSWRELYDELRAAADRSPREAATLLADKLDDWKRRIATESTTVISIDQFEELCISANGDSDSFMAFLFSALAQSGNRLVILATLRSDYLEAFQRSGRLNAFAPRHIVLNNLQVENIADIIEKPARVAAVELESGLVQALLHDASTDDALPLLAFTLRELYEGYGADRLLEVSEYRDSLGGLQGSVAKAADAVLASQSLSESETADLRLAFLALVRLDQRGYSRRTVAWNDLPRSVHAILERFVRARLLVSRGDHESRVLEVAHEALFRAWGTLREWLKEGQEIIRVREEVSLIAAKWEASQKAEDYLWRGTQLARAIELRSSGRLLLREPESNFLNASVESAQRGARRRRAWLRRIVALAFVAVVGMLFLVLQVERQRRIAVSSQIAEKQAGDEAKRQRQVAVAGALAFGSIERIREEPEVALLLAVESWRVAPTPEARKSLLNALNQTSYVLGFLDRQDSSISQMSFSPTGDTLVVGAGTGVTLIDAETLRDTGVRLEESDSIGNSINHVEFSPNGDWFAVGNVLGMVTIWDAKKHVPLRHLWLETSQVGLQSLPFAIASPFAIDPTGTLIAAGACEPSRFCERQSIYVFDVNDPTRLKRRLAKHTGRVTSLTRRLSACIGVVLAGNRYPARTHVCVRGSRCVDNQQ